MVEITRNDSFSKRPHLQGIWAIRNNESTLAFELIMLVCGMWFLCLSVVVLVH